MDKSTPYERRGEADGIELLPNSAAYGPAMYRLVNGARHRLSVLMYIFRPDESGRRFLAALVAAAHRGVAVRLIVDNHGSLWTPHSFFEPLVLAGGQVARFIPCLGRNYLVRMHQKLVAADDDHALAGGFNIGEEYFEPAEEEDFRELGLRMQRREAAAIHAYVERLHAWCAAGRTRLAELRQLVADASDRHGKVRWLLGGAGDRNSALLRSLTSDLSRARRLDAITGYFAPPDDLLGLVQGVARRGRVRFVVAGKTDVPLARAAGRHFYGPLLKTGCELFEYGVRPLHAKLIVIDDVVYAGSPNLDPRSLFINLELALRIEHPELAARARALIEVDAGKSDRISPEWLAREGSAVKQLGWTTAHMLLYRLDEALCRLLVR